VRRPPVRRGGRGLTFGRPEFSGLQPIQTAATLDKGGMERKSTSPSFFTERTLADFSAASCAPMKTLLLSQKI
jgi:hypothetical protein